MNKDNVLKVADAIEQHSIPDLGFNMGYWRNSVHYIDRPVRDLSGHNCGTVACIGGWTEAVLGDPVRDLGKAGELLQLDPDRAGMLFCPDGWHTDNAKFTTARAVAVLRHLAETGEVDWSVADKVAA